MGLLLEVENQLFPQKIEEPPPADDYPARSAGAGFRAGRMPVQFPFFGFLPGFIQFSLLYLVCMIHQLVQLLERHVRLLVQAAHIHPRRVGHPVGIVQRVAVPVHRLRVRGLRRSHQGIDACEPARTRGVIPRLCEVQTVLQVSLVAGEFFANGIGIVTVTCSPSAKVNYFLTERKIIMPCLNVPVLVGVDPRRS